MQWEIGKYYSIVNSQSKATQRHWVFIFLSKRHLHYSVIRSFNFFIQFFFCNIFYCIFESYSLQIRKSLQCKTCQASRHTTCNRLSELWLHASNVNFADVTESGWLIHCVTYDYMLTEWEKYFLHVEP